MKTKEIWPIKYLSKWKSFNLLVGKINSRVSKKQTVYIMPNRLGFYYSGLVFLLFMMALSYGNNFLLFFTFLCFAIFVYAQLATHFNLYLFKVHNVAVKSNFEGSKTTLSLDIENTAYFDLKNLNVQLEFAGVRQDLPIKEILSKTTKTIHLTFDTPKRGEKNIDRLKMWTIFPLDIFYVWRFYQRKFSFFSWPKPEGISLDEYIRKNSAAIGKFEYKDHQVYDEQQPADLIDWKLFARSKLLEIKNYEDQTQNEFTFDLMSLINNLGTEKALSQLTKWLIEIQSLGKKWTIKNQSNVIGPFSTTSELEQTLNYLAGIK